MPHGKTYDLRNFGNYGKNSKYGWRQNLVPSLPEKQIGTSSQKLHKNKYQSLSSCPVLYDFLALFHWFCGRLSEQIIFFVSHPSLLKTSRLCSLLNLQSLSQSFNAYITAHCAKVLQCTVFCGHYISCLV